MVAASRRIVSLAGDARPWREVIGPWFKSTFAPAGRWLGSTFGLRQNYAFDNWSPRLPNFGSVYTIDRGTGLYRGGMGTNAAASKRNVVFVPPDNSFYVASTSQGPNKSVDYLAVQDFIPGRLKPFVLATFSYVLTGTCER